MAVSLLEAVKSAMGITGTFQDNTLQTYINEVNEYLKSAGVDSTLIGTQTTAGIVARGVSDLWNYGAGEGKLSPYFYERVIQLSLTAVESEGDQNDGA